MRGFVVRVLGSAIAVAAFSAPALAAPITWSLVDVTFSDGGTASGSFDYDATSNQYTSIDVTTTTGSVRTGATYEFLSTGLTPSESGLLMVTLGAGDLTGTPGFALFFWPVLSDAGGTFPLLSGQEATCLQASCENPDPPQRFVTGGFITSETVPEPASALLLALGFTTLSLARSRRLRR